MRTCVCAGGAAKMRGPVRAPQHERLVVLEPLREELLNVVDVARPWCSHLEGVESRVPCAKLCMATPHPHIGLDPIPFLFQQSQDLTPWVGSSNVSGLEESRNRDAKGNASNGTQISGMCTCLDMRLQAIV